MTDQGKALTHAPARLDGKALPPGHSEGNTSYRCPIQTHVWKCYGCTENHTRAHQEDDVDYPVDGWYEGIETDRTWSRCRCMPCITKHLEWLRHKQATTGYDWSRLIARAEEDHTRAQEHLADVQGVLEARERARLKKQNADNAKSKLGPWEFTLTYSPRQHGWSRDEAQDKMREAITRLTSYYREEIEEFHATGEWNAAGDPHVHAWYRMEGGRKITTKSFVRAYPIWNPKSKTGPRGHVGGHHEPVKRTSDFAGYIQKHLDTAWLMVDITNAVPEDTSGAEAEDHAEGADHPPPNPAHPEGERT